jgi:redox-sensitive bicupin YhaK (pirin superfamily)
VGTDPKKPTDEETAVLTIRRDEEVYGTDGGWFQARWHFSFSHYRDPQHMGVGPLRVFNDDRIVAGALWPMHPHRHIESLTYVVEGTFEHADSLGNGGVLRPGAAQVMSFSGRGTQHSERNGSNQEPMRFLQFWILPSTEDITDGVQQHQYTVEDRTNRWLQIMGPKGEEGLDLIQDARVLVTRLDAGRDLAHGVDAGRGAYAYLIEGGATVNGEKVRTGDAAVVHGREELAVGAVEDAELILVDVPLQFEPVGVWARH